MKNCHCDSNCGNLHVSLVDQLRGQFMLQENSPTREQRLMLSSKGMKYVKGLRQEVATMSVPQLCKVDNSLNLINSSQSFLSLSRSHKFVSNAFLLVEI